MSTRATIQFEDEDETYYVYRGHDGHPETVLPDIKKIIEQTKGRWSGSGCALLTTAFIGAHFDLAERLPDYEITTEFHGDESYKYHVKWNPRESKWDIEVDRTY